MILLLEILLLAWRACLVVGAFVVVVGLLVALVEMARSCRWYMRP